MGPRLDERSRRGTVTATISSCRFPSGIDKLCKSRAVPSKGDIDVIQPLSIILTLLPTLLDGIDSNSGLTSLTVIDDEHTLTTTNGHHRVNVLNAIHYGLVHRITEECQELQRDSTTFKGVLATDRIVEGANNAVKKGGTDWDINNPIVSTPPSTSPIGVHS